MGKGEPMSDKQKVNWEPTDLIQEAFDVATIKHKDQVKKGTSIPYISHLMAVSALVIEHGGTEVQAAAGLLHDLIEDTDLKEEFLISALVGSDVTAIIVSCSDTSEYPKPPWRDRKEKYLVHLREMISQPKLDPAILVALADKVHNAETTANMVLLDGLTAEEIFLPETFNADASEQKWWYSSLVTEFRKTTVAPKLVERLDRAVKVIFK